MQWRWGVVAALALVAAAAPPAFVWTRGEQSQAQAPASASPSVAKVVAEFGSHEISVDARRLVEWVARTNDHAATNFVVVDKKHARIHLFDGAAHLKASGPVLIGGKAGDDSTPDIGSRTLEQILPHDRITPAGRFVGERGRDTRDEDVIWVSYKDGLALHRVVTTNSAERRLERLATPTSDDNRISYGCINLPVAFYEAHIRPAFATHRAAVYILPEVKSLETVFGISSGAQSG